jgi:hypothetical protein
VDAKQQQEGPMEKIELANATYWVWLFGLIEHWAFLAVVIALGTEFTAMKLGESYKDIVDGAHEMKVLQLAKDISLISNNVKMLSESVAETNAHSTRLKSVGSEIVPSALERTARPVNVSDKSAKRAAEYGRIADWELTIAAELSKGENPEAVQPQH